MGEAGGAYNVRARPTTAEVTSPALVPPSNTSLDTGTIGTSAVTIHYHHNQYGTLHGFHILQLRLCI